MMALNRVLFLLTCFGVFLFVIGGLAACSDDDDDSGDGDTDENATDDDTLDDDTNDDEDDDNDTVNDDDADDDSTPPYPDYPNDDLIRLNEIQVRGTHNSYHLQREPHSLPFLNYTQPPLYDQLEMGIRQFEIDFHYNHGNGLTVYHIPIFDPGTSCEVFTDCLQIIKDWSDAHPGHVTLFIFLEPKDDMDPDKLTGHDDEVEDEILSVWPREKILTPDDVRGDYDNLRDALQNEGWPTLGEVRDKALFLCFDTGDFGHAFADPDPSLAGRIMFMRSDMDNPYAGIDNPDDPIEEADEIATLAEDGILIRTRADANCIEAYLNKFDRSEAALASGAHMISTDFPLPVDWSNYWFDFPDSISARCNPVLAPDFCTSEDVENLAGDM